MDRATLIQRDDALTAVGTAAASAAFPYVVAEYVTAKCMSLWEDASYRRISGNARGLLQLQSGRRMCMSDVGNNWGVFRAMLNVRTNTIPSEWWLADM